MDKKSRTKEGLKFGILITTIIIASGLTTHLFNHDSLTFKNILGTIISALIGGCVGGLLNYWLLGRFNNSEPLMRNLKIDLEKDETILFQTVANHFKGIEAVGGKLHLTNQRLVFASHKFNFQNHQLSIGLPQILKVNKCKTLGIANTGLSVLTADNTIEKFVVQQPDEWINQLQQTIGLQPIQLQ